MRTQLRLVRLAALILAAVGCKPTAPSSGAPVGAPAATQSPPTPQLVHDDGSAARRAEQSRLDALVTAARGRLPAAEARVAAAQQDLTFEEPTYAVAEYALRMARQNLSAVQAEAAAAAAQAESYRRAPAPASTASALIATPPVTPSPSLGTPTPPLSTTGTWLSMFGGGVMPDGTMGPNSAVTLTLVQVGVEVSGQYESTPGGGTTVAPGSVAGALTGNVLAGTWRDTAPAAGTFRFEIARGGDTFAGEWAIPGGGSGSWNGQREPTTGAGSPPVAGTTAPSPPPQAITPAGGERTQASAEGPVCIYPSHSVFHLRPTATTSTVGAAQITTRPRIEVLRSTTIRRGREAMYFVRFLDGSARSGWMFIPVFELSGCTSGSTPPIATDGSEPLSGG